MTTITADGVGEKMTIVAFLEAASFVDMFGFEDIERIDDIGATLIEFAIHRFLCILGCTDHITVLTVCSTRSIVRIFTSDTHHARHRHFVLESIDLTHDRLREVDISAIGHRISLVGKSKRLIINLVGFIR